MAGQIRKSMGKQTSTTKRSVGASVARGTGVSKTRRPRSAATPITDEQVRERAFQIYIARQNGPGDACSDWYQAERELRGEFRR